MSSSSKPQTSLWQIRFVSAALEASRIGGFLIVFCWKSGFGDPYKFWLAAAAMLGWGAMLDAAYGLMRRGHAAITDHEEATDLEASPQETALANARPTRAARIAGGLFSALLLFFAQWIFYPWYPVLPTTLVLVSLLAILLQLWRLRLPSFARGGSKMWYPVAGSILVVMAGWVAGGFFQA